MGWHWGQRFSAEWREGTARGWQVGAPAARCTVAGRAWHHPGLSLSEAGLQMTSGDPFFPEPLLLLGLLSKRGVPGRPEVLWSPQSGPRSGDLSVGFSPCSRSAWEAVITPLPQLSPLHALRPTWVLRVGADVGLGAGGTLTHRKATPPAVETEAMVGPAAMPRQAHGPKCRFLSVYRLPLSRGPHLGSVAQPSFSVVGVSPHVLVLP